MRAARIHASALEHISPVWEQVPTGSHVNPRSAVALMEILYDKADPAEAARARVLYEELCGLTVRAGYQQCRTNVAHMHRLLEPVPQYQSLLDSMKRAVDPCGILAPGRYGIGSM